MAETLLALLLLTTSAKGSSLVFRWPESPAPSPRLSRPRPDSSLALSSLDNPWRASHSQEALEKAEILPQHDYGHDPTYSWQRVPNVTRDRSSSLNHSAHIHGSGRGTPTGERLYNFDNAASPSEYDYIFGFKEVPLVKILCAHREMCHSKFELVIDDLVFIGHPVCAEADGEWRFRPEKIKTGSKPGEESEAGKPVPEEWHSNPSPSSSEDSSAKSTLQSFHLVLVLDLPDPSSSASGNLTKYFNILYEQIAFTLTAVLYQEQVLSHFVETECDILLALKETSLSKGQCRFLRLKKKVLCNIATKFLGLPFSKYTSQALEISSIATAMKTIYEAIKSSDLAYVTINYLPLQLQLPPHIDTLLHSQDDQRADFMDPYDDDSNLVWGQSMSLGWKLPTMAPWKALVLLDDDSEMDPYTALRGPQTSAEDRTLAEGIIQFLETASVKLSYVHSCFEVD